MKVSFFFALKSIFFLFLLFFIAFSVMEPFSFTLEWLIKNIETAAMTIPKNLISVFGVDYGYDYVFEAVLKESAVFWSIYASFMFSIRLLSIKAEDGGAWAFVWDLIIFCIAKISIPVAFLTFLGTIFVLAISKNGIGGLDIIVAIILNAVAIFGSIKLNEMIE